ncbi:HEAT repeat domain-containing protein [Pedosphaera parvula]|uniref:PBS lyase HEAT domain protein repeat-containing protein n=1 Tax=Pedosphaera parvula (strain Ellin514) TaxID=320771 RepID=B9XAC9_PEDPL|nr:HEAT repeat domain-containing protein [Pedosphaera parvula]EEF63470.1 hypothetical protein Cflav_PD6105 [Pedosphaera parvula Ellin514]
MAIIVTLALRNSSDPVYRGIRLSVWLEGYNRYSQKPLKVREANHEAASEAVRHLGTNAIPRLLSMLRARDSDSTRRLIDLLRKQHFIKIPPVPSDDKNYEAEYAFIILGASASNAVPELVRIYGMNRSLDARRAILTSLEYIGPAARDAVPFLLQELTNTNPILRAESIRALGAIHSQPEIVVPSLTKYLHDADVRSDAGNSLALFGVSARSEPTEVLKPE